MLLFENVNVDFIESLFVQLNEVNVVALREAIRVHSALVVRIYLVVR